VTETHPGRLIPNSVTSATFRDSFVAAGVLSRGFHESVIVSQSNLHLSGLATTPNKQQTMFLGSVGHSYALIWPQNGHKQIKGYKQTTNK
jgi:hypothetical protein